MAVLNQQFEVHLSRADYAAGLTQLARGLERAGRARRQLLFARLAVYVLILVIIAIAFPEGSTAVVASVFLFWLAELPIQAAFKVRLTGVSFDPDVQGRTRVEFNDRGIIETGKSRTRNWEWASFRRVHVPDGYVVLEFRGWDMIVLPDRLWEARDERLAFVSSLEALQDEKTPPRPSSLKDADASLRLIEPVLIARLFVCAQVFESIFDLLLKQFADSRTSGPIALAGGSAAAATAWWVSGRAFRWLAARSPAKALAAAWIVIAAMILWFNVWILGRH